MEIILAKNIGPCFGVKRAFEMVEKGFQSLKQPVFTLGPLAHNEAGLAKLKKLGIKEVAKLKGISNGTIVISAHGVSPTEKLAIKAYSRKVELADATCPMVAKTQFVALQMNQQGRQVLIFGDKDHREVKGLLGAAGKGAKAFTSSSELKKMKLGKKKIGIIAQTTQSQDDFWEMEKLAKELFKDVIVQNTICQASRDRQRETKEIAKKAEIVLVVGSKTSANTKRLVEICKKINSKTYLAQNAGEAKKLKFKGIKSVGIISGASTPMESIEEIIVYLQKSK